MNISISSLRATVALFFCCFLFHSTVSAQTNISYSPYSLYGYGKLADPASSAQQGMGRIGYGLRNSQLINTLNPAAVSAVDSMTFMFDIGATVRLGRYTDGENTKSKPTAGIEYVALQFPLAKNLGLGAGLEPISYIGYKFGEMLESEKTTLGSSSYIGSGGLNKVYLNLAYSFWDNRLSLGAKGSFLYGSIFHDKYFTPPNVLQADIIPASDSLHTRGLLYEFGLQYRQVLNKKQELIFGAVYAPKTPFGMKGKIFAEKNDREDTTIYINNKLSEMPETYGFGITYHRLNQLTAGADFQYQKWADVFFYNAEQKFSNRMKANIGAEYIPNYMSRKFFDKIRYRMGAYFSDSYFIDTNNSQYKELGFSLGLGIPMIDRRSYINVAFEYSRLMPSNTLSMSEDYFKFTLSYTLNELWFHKRKLQ